MAHEKSKIKYCAAKFKFFLKAIRRTWKIVNEIRGKEKLNIKASFILISM